MRCPKCYRRMDVAHQLLGHCTGEAEGPRASSSRAKAGLGGATKSRTGYVPPCRRGRLSRADYDAQRATTPEEKRLLTNARAARYRARKAAA